jgi:ribosome-binding protein aMBF1 (putative translation factor)
MVVSSACTQVVETWTGSRADALRRAMGMTNESFAHHLGISVRIVAYWRKRPDMVPRQQMQDILETALEQATERAKEKFAQLTSKGNELLSATPGLGSLPQFAEGNPGISGPRSATDEGYDVALVVGS